MHPPALHKRQWPSLETPDLAIPAGMRRERFHAMGTTISLLLPIPQLHAGSDAVRALFAHWERTLSRFQPQSELSVLNARAGEPVAVSPLLYSAIEVALEAARATDGLFDPTLLRQLLAIGYDRSFELLPPHTPHTQHTQHTLYILHTPRAISVAGPGGGWRAIRLEPEGRRVTLPRGVGLDLGGIAKGMAVDAALARLRALEIDAALVNAGGDLAVHGVPPGQESWPVVVAGRATPWTVALQHGALATSGVGRRRWRQGMQDRHHLVNPRSGQSAQSGLWSVSVGAASCAQAEVAAKVACVLGPDAGARFLTAHGLTGLLVQESGAWRSTGGWPAPAREGSVS